MSSKKRKNIRRERRRVREAGIDLCWLRGEEISDEQLSFFYTCYHQTIAEHGSFLYLNQEFFETLRRKMPEQIRLLLAQRGSKNVAAGFFVCADNALYAVTGARSNRFQTFTLRSAITPQLSTVLNRGFRYLKPGLKENTN